eukprot:6365617-Prymnesium_polylepis.1
MVPDIFPTSVDLRRATDRGVNLASLGDAPGLCESGAVLALAAVLKLLLHLARAKLAEVAASLEGAAVAALLRVLGEHCVRIEAHATSGRDAANRRRTLRRSPSSVQPSALILSAYVWSSAWAASAVTASVLALVRRETGLREPENLTS